MRATKPEDILSEAPLIGISGMQGQGKSTFAAGAKNLLYFQVESGALTSVMPEPYGNKECLRWLKNKGYGPLDPNRVIVCKSLTEFDELWLREFKQPAMRGKFPYDGVVIDSFTELHFLRAEKLGLYSEVNSDTANSWNALYGMQKRFFRGCRETKVPCIFIWHLKDHKLKPTIITKDEKGNKIAKPARDHDNWIMPHLGGSTKWDVLQNFDQIWSVQRVNKRYDIHTENFGDIQNKGRGNVESIVTNSSLQEMLERVGYIKKEEVNV